MRQSEHCVHEKHQAEAKQMRYELEMVVKSQSDKAEAETTLRAGLAAATESQKALASELHAKAEAREQGDEKDEDSD